MQSLVLDPIDFLFEPIFPEVFFLLRLKKALLNKNFFQSCERELLSFDSFVMGCAASCHSNIDKRKSRLDTEQFSHAIVSLEYQRLEFQTVSKEIYNKMISFFKDDVEIILPLACVENYIEHFNQICHSLQVFNWVKIVYYSECEFANNFKNAEKLNKEDFLRLVNYHDA